MGDPIDGRGGLEELGDNGGVVGGLISNQIMERKLPLPSSFQKASSAGIGIGGSSSRNIEKTTNPSTSRFSRRFRKSNECAKTGFPHMNHPIGTFAKSNVNRKFRVASVSSQDLMDAKSSPRSNQRQGNGIASHNDKMIENMSPQEVIEAQMEIKGFLSEKSIEFLKSRNKMLSRQQDKFSKPEVMAQNAKEISNGCKKEDNDDRNIFHTSTSSLFDGSENGFIELSKIAATLRSSVIRQRLLAAKQFCEVHLKNFSAKLLDSDNMDSKHLIRKEFVRDAGLSLPSALRSNLDHLSMKKLSCSKTTNILCMYCLQGLALMTGLVMDDDSLIVRELHIAYFLDEAKTDLNFKKKSVDGVDISSPVIQTGINDTKAVADDGKDFFKDPSWTLLTRFRIIPCLANLLVYCRSFRRSSDTDYLIPKQSFQSLLRILFFVTHCSTSAAIAIARHDTIIPEICYFSLQRSIETNDFDTLFSPNGIAIDALNFFVVVVQQSRSAAESVHIQDILPHLHAILSCNPLTSKSPGATQRVQCCALFLWRSLLRYDLSLHYMSAFLRLTPSLYTIRSNEDANHMAEYLSAYSNVIKAVFFEGLRSQNQKELKVNKKVSFTCDTRKYRLTEDQEHTINNAGVWLIPLVNDVLSAAPAKVIIDGQLSSLKLFASKIRLISSYFQAFGYTDSEQKTLNKGVDMTTSRQQMHMNSIYLDDFEDYFLKVLRSDLFTYSLSLVFRKGDLNPQNITNRPSNVAAACALVKAVSELACMFMDQDISKSVPLDVLRSTYLGYLKEKNEAFFWGDEIEYEPIKIASRRWYNAAYSSVVDFVLRSYQYIKADDQIKSLIQSSVIKLIGNFEVGEESLAVMILSSTPLDIVPSSLSSFLIHEFCFRSERAHIQFIHSQLIQKCINLRSPGHFDRLIGLKSLQYEAEVDPTIRKHDPTLLLPVGKHWLMLILAGHVEQSRDSDFKYDASSKIIEDTLQVITYMENSVDSNAINKLSNGSKLYFVLNILLQDEEVIRNSNVQRMTISLASKYGSTIGDGYDVVSDFISTCDQHSSFIHKSKTKSDREDISKLISLQSTEEGGQVLYDFVDDLCTAFCEFGAQYEIFIRCMRIFFVLPFSPRIISLIIRKLKDVLALLTDEKDSLDLIIDDLNRALHARDRWRDTTILLDTCAFILSKTLSASSNRPATYRNLGFCYAFGVSSISRALLSIHQNGCILGWKEPMVKRLRNLDKNAIRDIYSIVTNSISLRAQKEVEIRESLLFSVQKTIAGSGEEISSSSDVEEIVVLLMESLTNGQI